MNTIIDTLKQRFDQHPHRHPNMEWNRIEAKLLANPEKVSALTEMERTGGEPDVISYDPDTDRYLFCDCSPETPKGRRSVCYDREGQDSRKEHRPLHNALDMAAEMGVTLLDEHHYRNLQNLEPFDTKTSSWILTPPEIRTLGGALFCDRRYNQVFVYHNGAQSYYAVRGFRACLSV
jgi:hypothetical protein